MRGNLYAALVNYYFSLASDDPGNAFVSVLSITRRTLTLRYFLPQFPPISAYRVAAL